MKIYLTILVLIFSLQSWVKADDIKDFQIEGMSVGESLLEYMSENEIELSKRNYVKEKKRYYVVGYNKNLKNYDTVDVYLKTGDKKYLIKSLAGTLFLKKKECLIKRDEIVDDLRSLFNNAKEVSYDDVPHSYDKTGKTKQFQTAFLLKNSDNNDHIRVECTDWSKKLEKENNWADNLGIGVLSKEILQWFMDGYN